MKILSKTTAGSKDLRTFNFVPKLVAKLRLRILQGLKLFLVMGFSRLSM